MIYFAEMGSLVPDNEDALINGENAKWTLLSNERGYYVGCTYVNDNKEYSQPSYSIKLPNSFKLCVKGDTKNMSCN